MKALIQTLAALTTIIALTGCGGGKPTHEEVATELMDSMEEFADAIGSVKDDASADKAIATLEKLGEKMKKLKEQADELGDPPADVQAKLEEQMKERQAKLQAKMMGMMGTMMAKPELMEKLKPAMDKIGKLMEEE